LQLFDRVPSSAFARSKVHEIKRVLSDYFGEVLLAKRRVVRLHVSLGYPLVISSEVSNDAVARQFLSAMICRKPLLADRGPSSIAVDAPGSLGLNKAIVLPVSQPCAYRRIMGSVGSPDHDAGDSSNLVEQVIRHRHHSK